MPHVRSLCGSGHLSQTQELDEHRSQMGGLRDGHADGQIGWRMVILPILGGGFKHFLFFFP